MYQIIKQQAKSAKTDILNLQRERNVKYKMYYCPKCK